jgi:hypothetical protein
MAITLVELRLQTRQRADQEKSKFVTDAELTGYINSSIAELKDLLLEAYGSEYGVVDPYQFSTVADTNQYALPADFYELKGVDIEIENGRWCTIDKFNFNERNRWQNLGTWNVLGLPGIRYRLLGDNIMFAPTPDSNVNVKIWYVPVATKLVNDTDELNDLNAYSEYVITDAAIKCMQKEESDVTVLVMQKEALRKRIVDKAANRDANKPSSVSDIYAEEDDWGY